MIHSKIKKSVGAVAAVVITLVPHSAFAADTSADASKVNNYMLDLLNTILLIVGGASALVLAIAGLIYVFSTGNPERLDKAKTAIIFALIGAGLAIGAKFFAQFFIGLATKNFGS